MTIDERLEYIATLQQTHDEQIGKLIEQADRNEEMLRSLGMRVDKIGEHVDVLTQRTIQAMEAINRLARIVDIHEDRIDSLEHPRQ